MKSIKIYSSLFVIALATLAFEITLSRLLSVVTWYSISFFAISVAMLGMTAGSIAVFFWKKDLDEATIIRKIKRACFGFGLTVPLAVVVCSSLELGDFSGAEFQKMFFKLIFTTAIVSTPFLFSGIAVSALLTRYPLPINRLYASDLIGASLGCLTVLVGLTFLDTPSFGILCAFLGILAAVLLIETNLKRNIIILAAAAILVVSSTHGLKLITPAPVKGKPFAEVDLDIWNSFSRIIVSKEKVSSPELWAAHQPFIEDIQTPQRYFSIDGLAGTAMRKYETKSDIEHLQYDVTNIAYFLRPTGGAAIIGVGGAKDIQSALLFGHENVLGVEINPIFIDLLTTQFSDFAGVGNNDKVNLVVDEARSYMAHSTEHFNILQMSLIDTWASTGAGAFSLTENGLYTVEAWKTFLSRLNPEGIFTVSRWYNEENPGETSRMISLAVQTLFEMGITDPQKHIAVVTRTGEYNKSGVATLVLAIEPLSPEDIDLLFTKSEELHFKVAMAPNKIPENETLAKIISVKNEADLQKISDDAVLNISAPRDENPYFFNMLKAGSLKDLAGLTGKSGVLMGNLVATINLVMLIAVLGVLIVPVIIVPLIVHAIKEKEHTHISIASALFFALIGAGFMLVEIGMLQRLSVFLGHPIYALGILLFGIILATGIGSAASEKIDIRNRNHLILISVITAVSALIAEVVIRVSVSNLMTYAMPLKVLAALVMIIPLGFFMGFFFPTGMHLTQQNEETGAAWYWAINGIFSVLFSALAVFISIYASIATNFYIGAACYLLTAVCFCIMLNNKKS